MQVNLGFSTGCLFMHDISLYEKVLAISEVQTDVIEIGLKFDWLTINYNPKLYDLLKKFNYVSMHAATDIRYPFHNGVNVVDKLKSFATKTNASCIVFHPEIVDDFNWMNSNFGNLVAFENMDIIRQFGNTVADMQTVFERSPQAKFVCDLNHVFSLDKTMKQAVDYHKSFGDRLIHYHVSALDNLHTPFCTNGDEEILTGIQNFRVPIVNEGPHVQILKLLQKEYDYTIKHIMENPLLVSPLTGS